MSKKLQKSKRKIQIPKISPVGEVILASIAVAGIVTLFALLPGLPMAVAPFLKRKKYSHKQAIERNLKSLIRSGLVKRTIKKDGTIQLEITRRGKWEALLRNSHNIETKQKKWDQVWRVVVFDVPISKNKLRRELRRAMNMYGFKILQQSVWVYPYPCDDFITILKTHLGVSNDVLYMKVGYIENDTQLRNEFGIE